jgi:hypothetical protein
MVTWWWWETGRLPALDHTEDGSFGPCPRGKKSFAGAFDRGHHTLRAGQEGTLAAYRRCGPVAEAHPGPCFGLLRRL